MAIPAYVSAAGDSTARTAYTTAIAAAPEDAWAAHIAALPEAVQPDAKTARRKEKNRQSAKRSAARKHSRSNTTEALCITKSVELLRAKERIRLLEAAVLHYAASAAMSGPAARATEAVAVCGGYNVVRRHSVLCVRAPGHQEVLLNGSDSATTVAIGGPLAPIVVGVVRPHFSWRPSLGLRLVVVAWSAATGAVLSEAVTDGPVVATAASSRGAAAITATTLYTLPALAQPIVRSPWPLRAFATAATAVAVDNKTDTVVWGTADAIWAAPLSTSGEARRLFAGSGGGPVALAVNGTTAIVAGRSNSVDIYTASVAPRCVTVPVADVLDVAVDDVVAILCSADVRTLTLDGEIVGVNPRPAGSTHVTVQNGAPVCF